MQGQIPDGLHCIGSMYTHVPPSSKKNKAKVETKMYLKGAGGGYLGFRLWKMSFNTLLIEGVVVVI